MEAGQPKFDSSFLVEESSGISTEQNLVSLMSEVRLRPQMAQEQNALIYHIGIISNILEVNVSSLQSEIIGLSSQ